MEYVQIVLIIVTNVQEPLIHVPNVPLEEMYHQIVTVHQEHTKKKILLVLIVTGNVQNVMELLMHVPHVEETEKQLPIVNVHQDIMKHIHQTVHYVTINVLVVKLHLHNV